MAPPTKPKDNSSESDAVTGKTLVILAKPPDKSKSNQSGSTLTSSNVQTELLRSPTIAQKVLSSSVEQDEGVTPSQIVSVSSKESESFSDMVKNVAQRVFHVQQKPSSTQVESGDQKLFSPPEMTVPVKLVDESLQWCDNALEYLHDANEFYVIGVLGLQGVGKSTIMSIISGNHAESSKWQLFKPQTNDLKEMGEHCTAGIDMYVTNQRLILLDTQPVMSASVMDHMIQYEKKPPGGPDYHSVENALLMQSLQQAAFLMAVCHTIISVQDWFIDINYLRFLLSAEMLKPTTPINVHDLNPIPEETSEYYPHIVFVQNRCQRESFYPESVAKMQDTLHSCLQKSKLKYSGSVKCSTNTWSQKDFQQKVNMFLLPDKEISELDNSNNQFPEYKGHPGYRYLAESLSQQVLSMPRSLLTHSALSEKNWHVANTLAVQAFTDQGPLTAARITSSPSQERSKNHQRVRPSLRFVVYFKTASPKGGGFPAPFVQLISFAFLPKMIRGHPLPSSLMIINFEEGRAVCPPARLLKHENCLGKYSGRRSLLSSCENETLRRGVVVTTPQTPPLSKRLPCGGVRGAVG